MMALRLLAANRTIVPDGVQPAGVDRSALVVTDRSGGLWLLDSRDLSVLCRWQLDKDDDGTHAVRTSDRTALVSGAAGVTLLDAAGRTRWSFEHAPWEDRAMRGAAWFDGEGRPFALVPAGRGCEIVHLDAATGAPLHRAAIRTSPAGVEVIHQPGGWVGLSVGEGQDGVYAWWVRLAGDQLELFEAPWDDEVLVDVTAAGNRVLTTPHADGPIRIRSFPGLALLREIPPPAGLGWDFDACFAGAAVVARALAWEAGSEVLVAVGEDDSLTTLARTTDAVTAGPRGSWLALAAGGLERWDLRGDAAQGGAARDD